jgi:Ca2+-binding RTX toxin-like protein
MPPLPFPTIAQGSQLRRLDRRVEDIVGGNGADVLIGNQFRNQITGGPGKDSLEGFAGVDRIYARDGENDHVGCGGKTKPPEFAKLDLLPRDKKPFGCGEGPSWFVSLGHDQGGFVFRQLWTTRGSAGVRWPSAPSA